MKYKYYLILFIVCLQGTGPVLAQDTRYRIELLVLTHLEHDQDPRELNHLEDYSPATDFLTPPPPVEEEENQEEAEQAAEIEAEELTSPEQYLSWEQGSEAPFPALRVHDLEVVMVDDPYAELRRELLEQSPEDDGSEGQPTVFADAAGLDALSEAEEPELPDPTFYYRLDGTAMLKRTRFLHLDLDLQLRQAVWDEESIAMADIGTPEHEQPQPSAFLVHDMQQSRQVKTGRMEYFDGPVLGVLAFITSIEPESQITE
jgi:hypothetical protein